MGFIDWLFCDNTPNVDDLKNLKKENDLNIKKASEKIDLNINGYHKDIVNKENDTEYVNKYNRKLLDEIERHFEKNIYKISHKGEDFYICYIYTSGNIWWDDTVNFVVVDKTKYKDIIYYKNQGLKAIDVFNKGLFSTNDLYKITYDDSKMIKINDLFNELGEMIYKDVDIIIDVRNEMDYFFSKVGKCHED